MTKTVLLAGMDLAKVSFKKKKRSKQSKLTLKMQREKDQELLKEFQSAEEDGLFG